MATSPEDLIDQIIANALETATDYTGKVDTAAQALIAAGGGVYFDLPSTTSTFSPAAIEPDIPTVADSTLTYEANLELIVKLLSDQLAAFFALYYPLDSDAFDETQAWIVNSITNGGTGINADVEAQLWQRARDKIITDGLRIENQIITGYAAKNLPLPAGSMYSKIEEARFVQLGETGAQATAIASQQFNTEVENIRFAIGKAIESRQLAMSAAADYIRAIASAPDSAKDLTEIDTDAQARMMSAASDWYRARLQRDDLVLKSNLATLDAGMELWKGRKSFAIDALRTDANALAAAADAYGRSASASLSSLNSIVSTATNSFS